MAEHTKRRRLAKAWATGGIRDVYLMAANYVKWRVHGSPAESVGYGRPALSDWVEYYSELRPDPARANPVASFSLVCPVYNTPPQLLEECVDSVLAQVHENWELVLVDDASSSGGTKRALEAAAERDGRIRVVGLEKNAGIAVATNVGIDSATNDYVVFIDHDDRLAPLGLEWVSTCCPGADVIYTDEDKISEEGEHSDAFYKPSWSPRMLLGLNYVNHLTCVRTSLLREVGGILPGTDGVQDHDLLLRISERDITIAHVPYIAYHWRAWDGSVSTDSTSKIDIESRGLAMVQRAIDRRGWRARAALGDGAPFNYRVVFEERAIHPVVKVIIPTRDRVRLLRGAVGGVLSRTDGVDVHLVVVDNGSERPETIAYLEQLVRDHDNVTVIRIDDAFNFSVLCNSGADVGPQTPYLLFLNNDVEVLHRNWLQQLVGWLDADSGVVGVGPKLLFPDRTIQHAGVILGFRGIAGHYAEREPNLPRINNLHDQTREVACLTAACLLVRTGDFRGVGGFNESLDLDFQDVDLALRLRTELEGDLVYDPTYPMIHVQSATRGANVVPSEYTVARLRFLWDDHLDGEDPYYSPHLSLSHHNFSLRDIPENEDDRRHRVQARWARPRFRTGD